MSKLCWPELVRARLTLHLFWVPTAFSFIPSLVSLQAEGRAAQKEQGGGSLPEEPSQEEAAADERCNSTLCLQAASPWLAMRLLHPS